MVRLIGQRLTSLRKLPLDRVTVVAIAMTLAVGMMGSSRSATQRAEVSNRRLGSFKKVSIKLNEGTACCAMSLSKDRFVVTDSAMDMIMFAYGQKFPLKPAQVLGGPNWMKADVFRIDAEPSKSLSDQVNRPLSLVGQGPEVPGPDVAKQAFRSLLINRFKLRVRHETKVLPVYELVLAKNGAKIAKDETADRSCLITGLGPGKGHGLDVKCDFGNFAGVLSAMPELKDRVLVDETGLRGHYSFKLHWTPKMPTGMHTPTSGPSLFTALREQLGLEVKSITMPVDAIAIEHIQNPAVAAGK